MTLRWAGAALSDSERRLRKLRGHRGDLLAALKAPANAATNVHRKAA